MPVPTAPVESRLRTVADPMQGDNHRIESSERLLSVGSSWVVFPRAFGNDPEHMPDAISIRAAAKAMKKANLLNLRTCAPHVSYLFAIRCTDRQRRLCLERVLAAQSIRSDPDRLALPGGHDPKLIVTDPR